MHIGEMMRYCFLDMDGVLADFVAGACAAHGRSFPYTDPANLGIFELVSIWGMSEDDFYAPLHALEFWENLSVTPEAYELVSIAESAVGSDNVALLTTAPAYPDGSIAGKLLWVKQHFPQFFRKRVIFCRDKRFLASSDALLVDDRDRNVTDFINSGGHAILFPRAWNALHSFDGHVDYVRYVRNALNYLCGIRRYC